MAQRRMFSAKIIESAKFIKMPTSSQLLYFHLGMKADDDGIAEAFNVMRMIGASEDDLKILVAKNYVVVLNEDLVSFITDWNEHNLIRADRKVDSIYKNLLLQIIPEVQLLESKERKDTLLRSKMHKESDLPDKFNGIMRAMFFGEKCPVCGEKMTEGKSKPSIQHNNPISKGGKHNIDNISVICLSCNMTIKDNETNSLNNELVKQNWELYLKSKSVDSEWTESGQDADSIGKGSIGEDSIVKHKVCASEIDLIWNMYPRKDGKKESYAKIPKIIKEIGIESLTQCIESYKQKIKTENIDKKFIMQGSTFFNGRYMDFIETQSSNKQEPKKINVVIVEG